MRYSVLTIGTELAVLSPESPVRTRIFSYAAYFKAMHVILLCGRSGSSDVREGNVAVYPTNSRHPLLRYVDALSAARRVGPVDIISAQDPFETGFLAWLIARKRKVPLHVQVHTDFLAPEFAALSFVNRLRVLIANIVITRAARVRVVSPIIAARMKARFGDDLPISILPIFVDLERFRRAEAPTELASRFSSFSSRALVVSRLEHEKNVALAISAFAHASPKDACLIILGTGREYNRLEMLVTRLGLDHRVFFEHYRDPAPYYKLADIVLVPSKYEGYGQVIIEALAAGKPVLSTNVGIAAEAGAIVTTEAEYESSLARWYVSGPKTGELKNYPYASLEEYVQKYCADIISAA